MPAKLSSVAPAKGRIACPAQQTGNITGVLALLLKTAQNYYSFNNFLADGRRIPAAWQGMNYFFVLEVNNDEFWDLRL